MFTQPIENLVSFNPGQHIAQVFRAGEHIQCVALFLGDVVAEQFVVFEAREVEMGVIDDGVTQPRLSNWARQRRLPDTLRQPHPLGALPEIRLNRLAQELDLPDLVVVAEHNQDRLVIRTAENLKLTAFDQRTDTHMQFRMILQHPVAQAAREMHRHANFGMTLQHLNQRQIALFVGLGENVLEIADRLMIVKNQR